MKKVQLKAPIISTFLDAENVENAHLPEQLIQLLDLNLALAKKINQYDTRVLPKEAFVPTYSTPDLDTPNNNNSLDITKWLWALFILLLASERILSYYRSQ